MKTRVTGILLINNKLLLLEQNVDNLRAWSLPGGGLEEGETLEQALKRELKEETGLDVEVKELLYVCDYIRGKSHVLHITFLVKTPNPVLGRTVPGLDQNEIKRIAFIPIANLESYGFSNKFKLLVQKGFPQKGKYLGDKSNIGL